MTFMEMLTLHVNYVLSSLVLVAAFFVIIFALAYIFALIETVQERRARRRKEARNA